MSHLPPVRSRAHTIAPFYDCCRISRSSPNTGNTGLTHVTFGIFRPVSICCHFCPNRPQSEFFRTLSGEPALYLAGTFKPAAHFRAK
jgi:hypothetical protein